MTPARIRSPAYTIISEAGAISWTSISNRIGPTQATRGTQKTLQDLPVMRRYSKCNVPLAKLNSWRSRTRMIVIIR